MIRYVQGDATNPTERPAIVAHICNDIGAWGAGFVIAVSKRWPDPELEYRRAAKGLGIHLGMVQFVTAEDGLVVANMVAQRGVLRSVGPLVHYEALAVCLRLVAAEAKRASMSIAMPRIGCGIGGGKWLEVEPIIGRECEGVDVFVYDFAGDVWP